MSGEKRRLVAWASAIFAGILWGVGAVVAESALRGGLSPYSLSLARFGLGLPLLWILHACQRAEIKKQSSWSQLPWRSRALVIATGVAMALNVTSWFAGIERIGATLPTVISICFAPVIVTCVSVLHGYERFSRRLLSGLTLALIGVALIVLTGSISLPRDYVEGLAFSFSAAVLYSTVVLCSGRSPRNYSSITISAWNMTSAAVTMALIVTVSGVTWPASALAWLQVSYTGIVTTSIAYLAFVWAARILSPSSIVVGTLIEPLAAALLAALIWDRPLSAQQYAGSICLIGAMVLLSSKADARHDDLISRPA